MVSRLKIPHLLVSLCFLAIFHPSSATDRYYPDLSAFSENGRFKLIAQSPDNSIAAMTRNQNGTGDVFSDSEEVEELSMQPFSDHFEYYLVDVSGDQLKEMWSRKPKPNDYSPTRIMVSDGGWSVIYSGLEFLIIDPNGKDRGRVRVYHDVISEDDEDLYVEKGSAGAFWEKHSLWYFLPDHHDPPYLVIRTWWDKRVIIDVGAAKVISDPQSLSKAAQNAEITQVLKTLHEAAEQMSSIVENESCTLDEFEKIERYKAAVLFSSRIGSRKVVLPLLRKLEEVEYPESFGGYSRYRPQIGEPDPGDLATNTFRQNVHMALRKLGETPTLFPCVSVRVKTEDRNREYFPMPAVTARQRADRVSQIKRGMKPAELFQLMGGPDYDGRGSRLAYDIDAEDPYTLEIEFDENGIARKVLRYPADWQIPNEREALLF